MGASEKTSVQHEKTPRIHVRSDTFRSLGRKYLCTNEVQQRSQVDTDLTG